MRRRQWLAVALLVAGASLLIAASFALSAVAVAISLRRARQFSRKPIVTAIPQQQDSPLIRESERNGRPVEETLVQWSPETLRHILATELPDAQVIGVRGVDHVLILPLGV